MQRLYWEYGFSAPSSDLETIFQRVIPKETWEQIREAVRRIANYGAWTNDKVVPLLGGNVIGEIERALEVGPTSRMSRGWTPIIWPDWSDRRSGIDFAKNCEI